MTAARPMTLPTPLATLALLSLLVFSTAQANDTTPMSPPPPPEPARAAAPAQPLAAAQAHLQAHRYNAAVDELKRVNVNSSATTSADWNNLMGYALRKQAKPDLDAAQKHYDAALRINPQHPGALAYAGELALTKRDLVTAEAHLATLIKVCTSPCEPLDDLRQAVARYKVANKS